MACSSRACGPDESFATFDVMTRTDEESSSSLDLMHLLPMVCVCARVDSFRVCDCFSSSGDIYFWKVIWKVGHSGKFKWTLCRVIHSAGQKFGLTMCFIISFSWVLTLQFLTEGVKTTAKHTWNYKGNCKSV